MTKESILQLFDSFDQMSVMVIGDVMIDAYMWGKVERVSPEAPVPIVNSEKRENRLGGAANVALNIKALGATPILCSVIGDDEKGDVFDSLLKDQGLGTDGILRLSERKTTVKTRVISDGQHLLRVDEEIVDPLSDGHANMFVGIVGRIIEENQVDAIVFEDYDKGSLTPFVIEAIITFANSRNIPTLVDPKRRNFDFYLGATLFKPNFKELVEGLKIDLEKKDKKGIKEAMERLRVENGNQMIMTTLSEEGIAIVDRSGFYHVSAESRDIIDVSGAGDTVISTAALCIAKKIGVKEVALISNMAGGIVCEKVGVVPVDKNHLRNEVVKYFEEVKNGTF